jgi:hypothetical protein
MKPDRPTARNPFHNQRFVFGLKVALLVSIPVWIAAGLAAILSVQTAPISLLEAFILLASAGAELLLLRQFLNSADVRDRRAELFRGRVGAILAAPWSEPVKLSLALGGLSAAYLQYYFWDVQLQIAALHSVTVFVPVNALG